MVPCKHEIFIGAIIADYYEYVNQSVNRASLCTAYDLLFALKRNIAEVVHIELP